MTDVETNGGWDILSRIADGDKQAMVFPFSVWFSEDRLKAMLKVLERGGFYSINVTDQIMITFMPIPGHPGQYSISVKLVFTKGVASSKTARTKEKFLPSQRKTQDEKRNEVLAGTSDGEEVI